MFGPLPKGSWNPNTGLYQPTPLEEMQHLSKAQRLSEERAIAEANSYGIHILKERLAAAEKDLTAAKAAENAAVAKATQAAKAVTTATGAARTKAAATAEGVAQAADTAKAARERAEARVQQDRAQLEAVIAKGAAKKDAAEREAAAST